MYITTPNKSAPRAIKALLRRSLHCFLLTICLKNIYLVFFNIIKGIHIFAIHFLIIRS